MEYKKNQMCENPALWGFALPSEFHPESTEGLSFL